MDTELEEVEDEFNSEELFDHSDNDITYDPKRDEYDPKRGDKYADSDDSQG